MEEPRGRETLRSVLRQRQRQRTCGQWKPRLSETTTFQVCDTHSIPRTLFVPLTEILGMELYYTALYFEPQSKPQSQPSPSRVARDQNQHTQTPAKASAAPK